jgi:hypothetical protein
MLRILFYLLLLTCVTQSLLPLYAVANSQQLFSQTSFNQTVQRLPYGFEGHDVKSFYHEVNSRRQIQKGEFETTDQFKNRLSLLSAQPLVGNITIHSTLAFVTDYNLKASYNADEEVMALVLPLRRPSNDRSLSKFDPQLRSVTISSDLKTEYYTATNKFGATLKVERLSGTTYGLIFDIPTKSQDLITPSLPVGTVARPNINNDDLWSARLPMNIATAKSVKEKLKLIFICRFKDKDIKDDMLLYASSLSTEATFDKPYETNVIQYRLPVILIEIWIADTTTGKIYQKQSVR